MKRRPALTGAIAIAAGILLARHTGGSWIVFTVSAAVCLVVAMIRYFFDRRTAGRMLLRSPFMLLALLLASAASFALRHQLPDSDHITKYLDRSDTLSIRCTVIDQPRWSNGRTKFLASLRSISGTDAEDTIRVTGKATVTIFPKKRSNEEPVQIPYGAVITLRGLLQAPPEERNPGEFSYRDYLALNDIFAMVSAEGYSSVIVSDEREGNPFFEFVIFPSKEFIIRTIRTVMSGDEANFLIGLLLGDRTEISEEIKNAFMNTGTIHVLAVSGSHVVLVAEIIFVLLGILRFPRKPQIVMAIVILLYYMYLTGATPSVVRSTLMMIIFFVGQYREERTDVYNLLGASAIIILMIEPKQLFDVGFQLSFSAVFSIVYFYPKLNALIPKIPEVWEELAMMKWLWQLFAVSLAAQIGTLPFTALYFGKVSIVSLFANLLVVPLVGLIVTIGLTGALLGTLSLWIASCFSEVNNIIAFITLRFVKWAETVPYAVVDTATFGWTETVVYGAAVGLLFTAGNAAVQKRILLIAIILLNIQLWNAVAASDEARLRITFLDVGQGDGAVIRFPEGETMVVDAGPSSPGFDAGEKIVAPFLRRNGVATIDAVITSHPHADHLGGVPHLLRNFTVRRTIDAGQRAQSKLFYEYESERGHTDRIAARAGTIIPVGNARIYVLHPSRRFIDTDSTNGYSHLNESSVVFKLVYGGTSVLFTGDAEREAEEHLSHIYGNFLRSDILKAGHHGSSTSSSEPFVRAVSPATVVVSVARFNKFRHPSPTVIDRLLSTGATVLRTDREGAIHFESDGISLERIDWRSR